MWKDVIMREWLLKKENSEIFKYLFFGVCTTIINLTIFYIFTNVFHIHYMISNIFAWLFGVLFAYITNKLCVFKSLTCEKKVLVKETFSFFLSRIFTLGIDQILIFLLIGILSVNSIISKIISSIVVVIANYIFSKFFIFKNNDTKK